VVSHFAERASTSLLALVDAQPDRPLDILADDFRGQIIEIGRELLGGPSGSAVAASRLLEVAPPAGAGSEQPSAPNVSHLVQLQVVMDRPTPTLGDVAARVFVSEDGEQALIGWLERGNIYYTETSRETAAGAAEGAWTAVKRLTLTDELEAVAAAEILEKRVRRRR
jgi:hypothetical protein